MKNKSKITALFIVLSTFYLALFDWDWPFISQFKFSWAYTTGMAAALLFSMADRFLKHAHSAEFRWWKLIKTHLLAFLIFFPVSVFVVLPALGPPKGVWKLDYMLAFLLTYFFINVGPKIATIYQRFDQLLTPQNNKNKEG